MTVSTPTRIDLACGQNKREGFYGVDAFQTTDTDEVVDLLEFPWPWEDNSFEEVHTSHFVEHIPHYRPWFPKNVDGFWLFMDELWRVCAPDAKITIVHPFANCDRADQDPTHERRINARTWQYYCNRAWREDQKLDHYPTICNFECEVIGNNWEDMRYTDGNRHQEVIQDMATHMINIVSDLFVTLRAIKE